MGGWVPCLSTVVVSPELLVLVFIFFLVNVTLVVKYHSFWCGLAHHWMLDVIFKDTEGRLTLLGHAVSACCEVILKIGLQFVVLFADIPEEYE